MRRRHVLWAVPVLLAALVSCGDDDDDASSSTAATPTSEAGGTDSTQGTTGSTEGSTPADGSEPGSDEPIVIYGIFDVTGPPGAVPYPVSEVGFEAAVKAINDAGGVNGRMIDGRACDTQLDATAAATCAQSAVDDGAVAVITSNTQMLTVVGPIIAEANIPHLLEPLAEIQLADDNAYAFSGGAATNNAGSAVLQVEVFNSEKPVFVGINVPAALEVIPGWNNSRVAHGWPEGRVVMTPYGIPDAAPYASTILDEGTDNVIIASDNGDTNKLVVAIRQAGSDIPILRGTGTTNSDDLETLKDFQENMYVYGPTVPTTYTENAAVALMLEQFAAIDPDVQVDGNSAAAWMGVRLFAAAAGVADEITPEGIATALDTHEFDLGLLPTAQFHTPIEGCPQPRCFNAWITMSEVVDSQYVPLNDGEFVQSYGEILTATASGSTEVVVTPVG